MDRSISATTAAAPATTGETTMTSTRLNALFASTLATAFSFAFILLTMPVSALTGGSLA